MEQQQIWLSRVELSERIGVPVSTLAQWGQQGKGPCFARFGRHVRYALVDVVAWEQQQMVSTRD